MMHLNPISSFQIFHLFRLTIAKISKIRNGLAHFKMSENLSSKVDVTIARVTKTNICLESLR
jgi:hypothetical protein